ncbi:MAG: hypothetical protein EOO28_08945 [Comamonadaceae bacterium]|nr:MAG: hypothetical protein EOO28_08945 [Comamonadaceae bacterium]
MRVPTPPHSRAFRATAVALLAIGSLVPFTAARSQTISVSLSDNLVVLTDKQRSQALELVNLSEDPIEFNLTASKNANGKLPDGTSIVRWAPERALVQANRAVPMRVSSRMTPEMPPGEYMFKAFVRSDLHQAERRPVPSGQPGEEVPKDAVSMSIAIAPSLPVTVYVRHKIAAPMIDARPFVTTSGDEKFMGYFPVKKRQPEYSFVGFVQVVDKASNRTLNQGRLHLPPNSSGSTDSQVRVAWPANKDGLSGNYCLRIWDQFPASGSPAQETCG